MRDRPTDAPANVDMEAQFLGCCMVDIENGAAWCQLLEPRDLHKPAHREVLGAMRALVDKRKPLDFTYLEVELTKRGSLERIGGRAAMMGLVEWTATGSEAESLVAHLSELARQRRLITAWGHARQMMTRESAVEAFAQFDIRAREILSAGGDGTGRSPAAVLADPETFGGRGQTVSTGILPLDRHLTGVGPGEVLLIGAGTSVGKTALLCNIAAKAHINGLQPRTLFAQVEMTEARTAERLIAIMGDVAQSDVRALLNPGGCAEGILNRSGLGFDHGHVIFQERAIMLLCQRGLRPADIRQALVHHEGTHLLLVDYVQRMKADTRTRDRYHEITEISGALCDIAGRFRVAVIVASQFSRGHGDEKPRLRDLRDSGALEQDADAVLLLNRAKKEGAKQEKLEAHLAKNRHGPIGELDLSFNLVTGRIAESDEPGALLDGEMDILPPGLGG